MKVGGSQPVLHHRILVVEDDSTNRKLFELILRRAGATVMAAENGQIGVELALREPFDLILMDIQMPVMDGYEATQYLRQMGLTVPIVALTGNCTRNDEERCFAAGCSNYLAKPIGQQQLLWTIASIVNNHEDGMDQSVPPLCPEEGSQMRSTLPTDDSDFREIVEEFVDRLGQQLKKIQAAWEARDLAELKGLAHWLKRSGGTAGFPAFTAPAARLEKFAKEEEIDLIAQSIAGLTRLANQIVVGPATQEQLTETLRLIS